VRVDNKEILIGYISTLSDKECRDIYYLLNELKTPKQEWVEFDKVRITTEQFNKLIWLWGKDKTLVCIDILNKWLNKKNITKPISHYRQLIGWVENAYYTNHPANDKSIKYKMNIDTAWKAKKYIQNIPKELRAYDGDIKFLVEKFGTDILK
jgi:hypothetical protein